MTAGNALDHVPRKDAMAADLAWLLSSPSLLHPGALNGIAVGDADQGEAWACAIRHLEYGFAGLSYPETVTYPVRLGVYAESLMTLALKALPEYMLLASRLAVHAAKRTLGEYDFLLKTPAGHTLHIELAVKIYLLVDGMAVGPGLQDALSLKRHVLLRQLALSATGEGAACLPAGCGVIQPMAWVRGWIFHAADAQAVMPTTLNVCHLRGWWQCWGGQLPRHRKDSVWRVLPRMMWMAERRALTDCCSFAGLFTVLAEHFLQSSSPLMVAEYAPLAEGGAELARGMVVPSGWPDPAAFAALRKRVAARVPV